jgi:hypothetical protein
MDSVGNVLEEVFQSSFNDLLVANYTDDSVSPLRNVHDMRLLRIRMPHQPKHRYKKRQRQGEMTAITSLMVAASFSWERPYSTCVIPLRPASNLEKRMPQVHRTILSKDSAFFSTMFTLPQNTIMEEGSSDANPIVLTGDTAAEFRNFLWALYALYDHSHLSPIPSLLSRETQASGA